MSRRNTVKKKTAAQCVHRMAIERWRTSAPLAYEAVQKKIQTVFKVQVLIKMYYLLIPWVVLIFIAAIQKRHTKRKNRVIFSSLGSNINIALQKGGKSMAV